jgi:hypothetical protein
MLTGYDSGCACRTKQDITFCQKTDFGHEKGMTGKCIFYIRNQSALQLTNSHLILPFFVNFQPNKTKYKDFHN